MIKKPKIIIKTPTTNKVDPEQELLKKYEKLKKSKSKKAAKIFPIRSLLTDIGTSNVKKVPLKPVKQIIAPKKEVGVRMESNNNQYSSHPNQQSNSNQPQQNNDPNTKKRTLDDIIYNLNKKGLINNGNNNHINEDSDQFDQNTIFIGNLPPYIRKNDLRRIFQVYGDFLDLYYPKGKNFAFIVFKTLENAKRAIESTHGTKIDDTVIRVSLARTKKKKDKRQAVEVEEKKEMRYEKKIDENHVQRINSRLPYPHVDIREHVFYDDLY